MTLKLSIDGRFVYALLLLLEAAAAVWGGGWVHAFVAANFIACFFACAFQAVMIVTLVKFPDVAKAKLSKSDLRKLTTAPKPSFPAALHSWFYTPVAVTMAGLAAYKGWIGSAFFLSCYLCGFLCLRKAVTIYRARLNEAIISDVFGTTHEKEPKPRRAA